MSEYPECPKCSDIFGNDQNHIKAPKLLKCGDSICKECLEDLLKNTNEEFFLCPVCGKNLKKEKNTDEYITNKGLIEAVNSCFNIPEQDIDKQGGYKIIQFNVILLGNSTVGKTCIFRRLSEDIYSEYMTATAGFDTTVYYIQYKNQKYRLIFRDPLGQEKYKAVTQSFMRNTDGVLFIYDISNQESFYDLQFWYDLYKEVNENVVGLLIGNKCDREREVPEEEAKKLAKDFGFKKYLETSAKLDKNIKKSIACLLEEIINSKALKKSSSPVNNVNNVNNNFSLKSEKFKKKKKCSC